MQINSNSLKRWELVVWGKGRKLGKVRTMKKRLQKKIQQCHDLWTTHWQQGANTGIHCQLDDEQKNKVMNLPEYLSLGIHSCLAPVSICKMSYFHFRRSTCRRSDCPWLHITVGYMLKDLLAPIPAQNIQIKCTRTSVAEAEVALNIPTEIQLVVKNPAPLPRSFSLSTGWWHTLCNPVWQ